jgi:hypothetical protein
MAKVEFSEKEFMNAYMSIERSDFTFGNKPKLPDSNYCDLLAAGSFKVNEELKDWTDFYSKTLRGE